MSETKVIAPTPTPWDMEPARSSDEIKADYTQYATRIYANDPGPDRAYVIGFVVNVDEPTRKANTRFILQAVNAHEALVTALGLVDGWAQQHDSMPDALSLRIRAALALAKGGQ